MDDSFVDGYVDRIDVSIFYHWMCRSFIIGCVDLYYWMCQLFLSGHVVFSTIVFGLAVVVDF